MPQVSKDSSFKGKGLGWIADNPDFRDFSLDSGFLAELRPTSEQQNLKIISEIFQNVSEIFNQLVDRNDEILQTIKSLKNQKLKKVIKELPELSKTKNIRKIAKLIDYLEFTSENYSIFSIQYLDILRPRNSHPKVKEVKYHLSRFLQCIDLQKFLCLQAELDNELTDEEKSILEALESIKRNPQDFHKDSVHWARSSYYDKHLTVIVKLFQQFVGDTQKENPAFQSKDEKIKVDGIIGLDTFKALTAWLNGGEAGFESYRKAMPVPFPSPIPTEVLSLIITSFLPDDLYQLFQTRFSENFKEYVMKQGIENDLLREELLKDPEHRVQMEKYVEFRFYKLADFIAKQHYILIEPFILIILHFSGVIGAYKNLEYAIKLAASQFKFILGLDIDALERIINAVATEPRSSNWYRDAICHLCKEFNYGIPTEPEVQVDHMASLEFNGGGCLEGLLKILDLKILGSTEKLPDEFRLDLVTEIENLRWLQQTSYWTVYQFINRFYQIFLDAEESMDKSYRSQYDGWFQEARHDTCLLLFGRKNGDEMVLGLAAQVINLGLEAMGYEKPDEEFSGESEKVKTVKEIRKKTGPFLVRLRNFLEQNNLFDLIEHKPTVIEFLFEDSSSDEDNLNIRKIIEGQARNQFGYGSSYEKTMSVFDVSSKYQIPVGDSLVQNLYWAKNQNNQASRIDHLPISLNCPMLWT
jgi:hypothetical protein